jgi:hypothetical protein
VVLLSDPGPISELLRPSMRRQFSNAIIVRFPLLTYVPACADIRSVPEYRAYRRPRDGLAMQACSAASHCIQYVHYSNRTYAPIAVTSHRLNTDPGNPRIQASTPHFLPQPYLLTLRTTSKKQNHPLHDFEKEKPHTA